MKQKPKEILFWEQKSIKDVYKFKQEYLYLSLKSHSADFRVQITPHFFIEPSDLNSSSPIEKKKNKGPR